MRLIDADAIKLFNALNQLIKDIEFDELEEYLSCISHFNEAKKIINEIGER